jgi:hypothetical protein
MKKLLVALFLVLVLAACGTNVTSGTVIGKKYDPARSWQVEVPDYVYVPVMRTRQSCSYSSTTKSQTCRTETYTDMQMRYVGSHTETRSKKDEWFLVLRDSEGNEGQVSVSKDQYDGYRNGDWFGDVE